MSVSRYDLYEWCVQAPMMAARFLHAVHGGAPRVLEEHFSGPAAIARAWITLGRTHRASAIDRDPEPLAHALARAREELGRRASRLSLVRADVLKLPAAAPKPHRLARGGTKKKVLARVSRPDIIAAFNFAVCELHTRAQLLKYLRSAKRRLAPGGVLALDLYGGASAWEPGVYRARVRTPIGPVGYEWEQREAEPITAMVRNAIHFNLPARILGKPLVQQSRRLECAFEYHWRLWGIAELCDAMHDAGFASVDVYESYGDAIDERGRLYPVPISRSRGGESPNLASDLTNSLEWVVYVVGRRWSRHGSSVAVSFVQNAQVD